MRSETENQPQQRKPQPRELMNILASASWKIKTNKVLSTAALFLLIALSGRAFANTVGTCQPGNQYSTIQAAVTAATPGSTVNICPGTYPEQVLITKNLHLVGVASGTKHAAVVTSPAGGLVANGVDIFGNPVAPQIFVQNATVSISHLTVDGTGNVLTGCGGPTLEGIYYQNSSGTITDDVVRNQFQTDFVDYGGCQNGLAINVESLTNSSVVTVSDNSVRAYQKNGITATGAATGPGSPGPVVTITANYIVGLGATAMNWPGGAAENGVQVGFGASGTVSNNTVNDNIWWDDNSQQPGNAASGILVYASDGITISGNSVNSAQFGITVDTDPTYGPADNSVIESNKVSGNQIFDAIDLCSNANTAKLNTVYGSAQSAFHADDGCGSGNNNTITNNTVNEACAGILLGTGTGTSFSSNTFLNVTHTTLPGDVCSAPPEDAKTGGANGKQPSPRPSPFKPNRK
jgi:hypothetical protein